MKSTLSTTCRLALAALASFSLQPPTALAQGTAFAYQGQLTANGSAANGLYDLRFEVWDALTNGNIVAGPMTNSATGVTNGLFVVTLDFGPGVFTGPPRWLELDVRTNGSGTFTTLLPLQPLLPVPYSTMANTASNLLGTLPAAQLSGALPSSALAGYAGAVTFTNPANSFVGTFAGDGGGLTNLALSSHAVTNGQSSVQLTTPVFLSGADADAVQLTNLTSGGKPHTVMNFNTGTNIVIFNMGDPGGSRGSLIVNTAHGGSQSIAANTEWQFASPGHFAFGPGAGGHIQLGIVTYDEAHPYWGYWQYAEDSRSATRGFSGAQTFTVQMYASAGTATNSFHPGMFGQQDTVNGGYYLDTFADLGVTGGGGVKDAWNPTTIAPGLRLHFGNYRSTTLPGSVIMDQSLTTATTTQALSFKGFQYQTIFLPNATVTFSTADRNGTTSVAEKRVFILKSGSSTVPLVWPAGWMWLSGSCPANTLTNGMIMRLELESIGPGETNIIAFAQSGTDNTIAAAFDPTTISGLQAWLKADVYSGLPTGFQTNWWDSSGASPNRKADNVSAGAVLPSYVNNSIGGKPAFAFTSDVSFLTNGWNVADTDFTAFVVGRLDTTYNGQVLDRYGMNGFSLVAFGSTFTPYNSLRYYFLGNTVAILPQAEKTAFITAFGRTGTTFYAYNGSGTTNTTVAATALPTYCTGSPSICGLAIMSGAGGYPTRPGVIAEVLYYNTGLSSVNVSNVLGYLRTKYGTQ